MVEIDCCGMTFCCGATEIGSFGGGEEWEDAEPYSVKELVEAIKDTLNVCKHSGNSVVYATTMSNQPNAAEALTQLGFYTTAPFKRVGGGRRKMQAWFLPLCEYRASRRRRRDFNSYW